MAIARYNLKIRANDKVLIALPTTTKSAGHNCWTLPNDLMTGNDPSEAVKELFGTVAEKVANRPGGYTRIIKLGNRQDDAAPICFIELVDFDENMAKTAKKATRTRRSKKSAPKAEEAPAVEATAEEAKAE